MCGFSFPQITIEKKGISFIFLNYRRATVSAREEQFFSVWEEKNLLCLISSGEVFSHENIVIAALNSVFYERFKNRR